MKKLDHIIIQSILIFSLFQGCSISKRISVFEQETLNSDNIIFLVDVSGSVGEIPNNEIKPTLLDGIELVSKVVAEMYLSTPVYTKSKQRKLREKQNNILSKAINGLNSNTDFTVILFSTKIKKWRKNLVPSNKRNKYNAISFVNEQESRGESDIYGALQAAFNVANVNKKTVTIFLMSDGQPTRGEVRNTKDILLKVSGWNVNGNIRINTYALGPMADREFLEKLAIQNGGRFIEE